MEALAGSLRRLACHNSSSHLAPPATASLFQFTRVEHVGLCVDHPHRPEHWTSREPSRAGSAAEAAAPPRKPRNRTAAAAGALLPAAAVAAAAAAQSLGRVQGAGHLRRLRAMAAAALPAWEVRRVLACEAVAGAAQPAAVLRVRPGVGREEVRVAFRRLSLSGAPGQEPQPGSRGGLCAGQRGGSAAAGEP
ncbi:hypothetical protein HYH03_009192 [Edaphochlamys debaryana]|uniref:Uncharacterized protein n=1 Tax=Edaphochlamys debaryana TaxID=47281 RepID=A0A835XWQ8_9CHLO|nr:hypothetical protein HYH03_009192 [Edaphochlamys debaryana]|eukprot:KAG2492527.1 hypothetical protein HYH03_009192 [Edaphochlamys debaryana]